jgi:hypothetical protein
MKINIENFHASIDKKVLKSFVNIAKKFPNGTGFVPCYGSPELKKVPCKGANG